MPTSILQNKSKCFILFGSDIIIDSEEQFCLLLESFSENFKFY